MQAAAFVAGATMVPAGVAYASGGKTSTTRSKLSISIATPTSGSTVSGSITVSGSSSDSVQITGVAVSVDGGAFQPASGTTSWSYQLNTAAFANGSHMISAKATDSAANTSAAGVTVTFANADTTPPKVSIATPSAGTSVAGTTNVSGGASDNVAVAKVEISVDGGTFGQAQGTTTSWNYALDTTSLTNGLHTLTARATDTSGNAASTSESVSVQNASASPPPPVTRSNGDLSWTDQTLVDPVASYSLQPLGRGRQAEWGTTSYVLYWETNTSRRAVFAHDASTGTSSYVSLPVDTASGWTNADYVMTTASDLWVESGDGPVYIRHYLLSGSPVPTSAMLVSSQTFGDTDSRHGDITRLSSGALVFVWHQQGQTGPQGLNVGYLGSSGAWQVTGPLTFMPTNSSKQVIGQHPADGSIWVFNSPDAWGAIGALHMTEGPAGLTVDWSNGTYITTSAYGELGPDPENPDLAVAPDPSTHTLALAYQDDHRLIFQTSPTVVTGSYLAVDRIAANGAMSFLLMPVYVERVSSIGLVVNSGQTWLVYRPINQSTMTFSDVYANCYCNGAWHAAAYLGTLSSAYERVGYGVTQMTASAQMTDSYLHFDTVS